MRDDIEASIPLLCVRQESIRNRSGAGRWPMEVMGAGIGGTSAGEESVGLICWPSHPDAAILRGYSDL